MRFAGSSPQIASFMKGSPRFDEMGDMYGKARTHERNTSHEAEAIVAGSGLDAMGQVKAAGHQARGIEAQGAAAAAATQARGMQGMMQGIAGGIGNMSFGGGGGASAPATIQTGYGAGSTVGGGFTPSTSVNNSLGGSYDMSYGVT